MIERVYESQALIEKLLRSCVLSRNRMMQIAQARHHRDRLRRPHVVILTGGTDCETKNDRETNKNRETKQSTKSRDTACRVSGTTREKFHMELLPKKTKRTSILSETSDLKTFRASIVQIWPRKQPC